MPAELLIIAIDINHTSEQLIDLMRGAKSVVLASGEGAVLTISGFDSDPRELFEIPEVVALCRDLVSIGFISVLKVSTLLERDEIVGRFYGALEVWAIATGKMTSLDLEITRPMIDQLKAELALSNERCVAACNAGSI